MAVKTELPTLIYTALHDAAVPVKLKFLESQLKSSAAGNWVEIKVLLEIDKLSETNPLYFCNILNELYQTLKFLGDRKDIDDIGIQEMECGMAKYYYLLIYIHQAYNGE